MRNLALVVTLIIVLLPIPAAWGMTAYQGAEELRSGSERGFGEILDLWRDGKYDELYDRTVAGGKQTKEGFIGRLSSAPFRPACCWEKLQEVRVTMKSDDTAVIRAKVGLEGGGENRSKTRDFKLFREDGTWRISQADLLSLSGASGKKVSHKKKKRVYRAY